MVKFGARVWTWDSIPPHAIFCENCVKGLGPWGQI